MADKGGLVLTSQCQEEETKWLLALKRKENVFVCFLPKTDRLLLIQQILQNRALIKSVLGEEARYFFQTIELEPQYVEEKNEMCWRIADQMNYLRKDKLTWEQWMVYLQKHNVTLVLIVQQAERFLNTALLSYLSTIVDTYFPHVITLCLFERNVSHPSMMKLLPNSTRLYQNIFYYPIYSDIDSREFIRYLENRWEKKIPQTLISKVIELCGGYQWLIKEAVRQIIDESPHPFREEGIAFRLRMIYDNFLPSEQSLLTKVILHPKEQLEAEERNSLQYFQRMRLMDAHGKCLVRLYEDFIKQRTHFGGKFTIQNGIIYLNNVAVDRLFSHQERRVFTALLKKQEEIVTRDEVAMAIWPLHTQDKYSDWAIDQVIARLRKRLSELSLPPSTLKAVRGKGYLLHLHAS